MEPLEWIALIGLLVSVAGGVYSGVKDDKRYKEESDYRDMVHQEQTVKQRYKDLQGLGMNEGYALQAAAGMSAPQYGGVSYNQPYDFSDVSNSTMNDLIESFKAPAEKENIEEDTEGKRIDNEWKGVINQKTVDKLTADIDKAKKDGMLSEENARRIAALLPYEIGEKTANIMKGISETKKMAMDVIVSFEQLEISKRHQSNEDRMTDSNIELNESIINKNDAETENIQGQTALQADQHEINLANLDKIKADTNFVITNTKIKELEKKQISVMTLKELEECLQKDFELKLMKSGIVDYSKAVNFKAWIFEHSNSKSGKKENKYVKEFGEEYDFKESINELESFLDEYEKFMNEYGK